MQNMTQEQGQQPTITKPTESKKTFKPPVSNNTLNNKLIYELYLKKDYSRCLAMMSKSEGNQFHLYISGMIYRQQMELQKAFEKFQDCHMMDKLNYEYLKEISKTLFLQGKFRSSLEAANEAAKIRKDWELMHLLGKICTAMNESEKAVQYFNQSLQLEQNEQSYIELAKVLINNKRLEKAYVLLKDAAKFSQENPTIYEMLAILAARIDRIAESSVYFTICLESDQYNFNSLLGLGSIQQIRGQHEDAILKYKTAFQISPNSASLWNNTGLFFYDRKKNIQAYTCLMKSLYLDPFQWKTYANLGLACLELEKYMSAFVAFNLAISLNKDPTLFMLLGVSLANLKDYNNAQKAYIQAISMQKDCHTYINYGLMLLKKGDFAKAKEIMSQALVKNLVNDDKETLKKLMSLIELKQSSR